MGARLNSAQPSLRGTIAAGFTKSKHSAKYQSRGLSDNLAIGKITQVLRVALFDQIAACMRIGCRTPVHHRRGVRFTLGLDMVRGELLCDEAAAMRRRIVPSVPHTTYFA